MKITSIDKDGNKKDTIESDTFIFSCKNEVWNVNEDSNGRLYIKAAGDKRVLHIQRQASNFVVMHSSG